tara:strand:+ start:142 stop:672 length:531 start_codon:yes stop_codon:yes gene_type:complete
MPKFNGQNKKKINPRYFLYESVEREDLIDDIREFSKDVAGSRDTYGDIDKLALMDVAELKEYFKSIINPGYNKSGDNYRMAASVMQDDDKIPLSKKIPSGLSEENNEKNCYCVDASGEKTRDFVRPDGRGCRGSERKICPEKTFEPEARNIKNRYNKIDKMFDDSGAFTKKRGIDR